MHAREPDGAGTVSYVTRRPEGRQSGGSRGQRDVRYNCATARIHPAAAGGGENGPVDLLRYAAGTAVRIRENAAGGPP